MSKHTYIIDASAIKESSCQYRLFNKIVIGYRGKRNNNDIEWGQAFHKFRSHLRTHGKESFGEAMMIATQYYENTPMLIKPNKKYLTSTYLQRACLEYFTKYQNDLFEVVRTERDAEDIPAGTPLVEPITRFIFPYYVDDLMEVLMAGTMDEVGKFRNGVYSICDLKTTSVRDVESYFKSYDLSPQMLFYRWAVKQYAKSHPDSIIAKIESEDVYCFIDGVFTFGADKIELHRSNIMPFPDAKLLEFELLLEETMSKFIELTRCYLMTGQLPPRYGMVNGACQTIYGPCMFFNGCSAPDLESREAIFDSSFKREFYNPLNWGE